MTSLLPHFVKETRAFNALKNDYRFTFSKRNQTILLKHRELGIESKYRRWKELGIESTHAAYL